MFMFYQGLRNLYKLQDSFREDRYNFIVLDVPTIKRESNTLTLHRGKVKSVMNITWPGITSVNTGYFPTFVLIMTEYFLLALAISEKWVIHVKTTCLLRDTLVPRIWKLFYLLSMPKIIRDKHLWLDQTKIVTRKLVFL